MAKKLLKLSFTDIVLQADAETIREAYEARVQIDKLLHQRDEAYRQIEALEQQVEELTGEEGAFVYPAPPLPVAGFAKPVPASRPGKPKQPRPKPAVPELKKQEEKAEKMTDGKVTEPPIDASQPEVQAENEQQNATDSETPTYG